MFSLNKLIIKEELEQFDTEGGEYGALELIPKRYRDRIGFFVILFSSLEHSINLVIAEMLNSSSHDIGYRALAALSMREKIDLLNGCLLNFITLTKQNKRNELKQLKNRLIDINTFRNYLAHANWTTLKRDGSVRTKITTDNDTGSVIFKIVKVPSSLITEAIREADKLILEVDDFFMDIENEANGHRGT